MICDIAGQDILFTPSASDSLPIDVALHQFELDGPGRGCSLETIRFLAQADQSRPRQSLMSTAMHRAMWRGDLDVARYLLSYQECRQSLTKARINYNRPPLWYASRDILDSEHKSSKGESGLGYEKPLQITPFLQLLIESSAEQINREGKNNKEQPVCCCVVGAIYTCSDLLCGFDEALKVARNDPAIICCDAHSSTSASSSSNTDSQKRRRRI